MTEPQVTNAYACSCVQCGATGADAFTHTGYIAVNSVPGLLLILLILMASYVFASLAIDYIANEIEERWNRK